MPWYWRATPSVYCVVLGRPYVTRGLVVVYRTVGACPITWSSRHLTSHLFHSYTRISTTHFLRPQACVISFQCDFSVSQATSLGFWRQRDSHLSRYTSRLRPRLHMIHRLVRTDEYDTTVQLYKCFSKRGSAARRLGKGGGTKTLCGFQWVTITEFTFHCQNLDKCVPIASSRFLLSY